MANSVGYAGERRGSSRRASRRATFACTTRTATSISLESAHGDVIALTFIYTTCWDLCPAQAAEVMQAVKQVGKGVTSTRSVDPVGDTPRTSTPGSRPRLAERAVPLPDRHTRAVRARLARLRHRPGQRDAGGGGRGCRGDHALQDRRPPRRSSTSRRGRTTTRSAGRRPGGARGEPGRGRPDLPRARAPRGRARVEHSAYVLLIDKRGEQRLGIPFEQLDPDTLAQDLRVLRDEPVKYPAAAAPASSTPASSSGAPVASSTAVRRGSESGAGSNSVGGRSAAVSEISVCADAPRVRRRAPPRP